MKKTMLAIDMSENVISNFSSNLCETSLIFNSKYKHLQQMMLN